MYHHGGGGGVFICCLVEGSFGYILLGFVLVNEGYVRNRLFRHNDDHIKSLRCFSDFFTFFFYGLYVC